MVGIRGTNKEPPLARHMENEKKVETVFTFADGSKVEAHVRADGKVTLVVPDQVQEVIDLFNYEGFERNATEVAISLKGYAIENCSVDINGWIFDYISKEWFNYLDDDEILIFYYNIEKEELRYYRSEYKQIKANANNGLKEYIAMNGYDEIEHIPLDTIRKFTEETARNGKTREIMDQIDDEQYNALEAMGLYMAKNGYWY